MLADAQWPVPVDRNTEHPWRDESSKKGIARRVWVVAVVPKVRDDLCWIGWIAEHGVEVEHGVERSAGADPVIDRGARLLAAATGWIAHRQDGRADDRHAPRVYAADDELHRVNDLAGWRRRRVGAAADVIGALGGNRMQARDRQHVAVQPIRSGRATALACRVVRIGLPAHGVPGDAGVGYRQPIAGGNGIKTVCQYVSPPLPGRAIGVVAIGDRIAESDERSARRGAPATRSIHQI